jgi:AraC-like DNA-binding protein
MRRRRRAVRFQRLGTIATGWGYDDASQFSREYKRLFGQPPMRDLDRLREAARR